MRLQIMYNKLALEDVLAEGKTEDEFNQLVVATQEHLMAAIREHRDVLLAESDWTGAADAPITDEQRAAWQTYRQALRDFPATVSFESSFTMNDGSFPQKPE